MPRQYWKSIWRIIGSGNTSTTRNTDGGVDFKNGGHFKGLSMRDMQSVSDIVEEVSRDMMESFVSKGGEVVTAAQVRDSAQSLGSTLISYNKGGQVVQMVSRIKDSFGPPPGNSYVNPIPGLDRSPAGMLWISPSEAAAIYTKPMAQIIIEKKSETIVHNGMRIKNCKIDKSLMEKVNESSIRTNFVRAAADVLRDALGYGGGILFPFFKKDIPATMTMSFHELFKYDIIGKDCIDRYVGLDRNNVVHIPNWNPTQADFLLPKYYYVPYLGSDVRGSRVARITPVPIAGYWGALMTMGWGMSDITRFYQPMCNYDVVTDAVPRMIQQMSILVRSFNMDMSNAMNGAVGLEQMQERSTVTTREATLDNPINIDVIGELKAIERDFKEVPELYRLIRQDLAAKGGTVEEKIWSTDRGAFSSGDQTQGANEMQWERVRSTLNRFADSLKTLAMIEIVNALGKDRDIMKALPYTEVEFLPPVVENAEKRAKVIKDIAEGVFNLVASGMKLDLALSFVMPYGDEHLAPKQEVIDEVRRMQKEVDRMEKESHDREMKLLDAQIEKAYSGEGSPSGSSSASPKKKGEGYTPLEQKKKERTRGVYSRRESIQRAEGKKL